MVVETMMSQEDTSGAGFGGGPMEVEVEVAAIVGRR